MKNEDKFCDCKNTDFNNMSLGFSEEFKHESIICDFCGKHIDNKDRIIAIFKELKERRK